MGAMTGPNHNALAAEVRLLATCPRLQRLHGGTLQEAVLVDDWFGEFSLPFRLGELSWSTI